jgi:FixJ family two-component response regulator
LSCKELFAEFIEREIRLSIIVISAGSNPETKKIAKEMNAVGFFHKPVDGTALLDAIDWALRSGKSSSNHKRTLRDEI